MEARSSLPDSDYYRDKTVTVRHGETADREVGISKGYIVMI
jgi:hypothetical protein